MTKATWVAGIAAAATAIFGAIQIGREWWHERLRKRAAADRIEAIAYQLRRQLQSWIGRQPDDLNRPRDFEGWIRNSQNHRALGQHLDRAEQRLDALMALRPDASAPARRALERVYVAFLAGSSRLNEYAAGRPDDMGDQWRWIRLRQDAESDFGDCIHELERWVLRGFITAEQDNALKRDAEDPLSEPRHGDGPAPPSSGG